MKKNIVAILFITLLLISCSSDNETETRQEENFSSELFFSEYLEGSSFNKALEIVNLTAAEVDLEQAQYSIKKMSNGSGDWIGDFPLSGTIKQGEVFLLVNQSADLPVLQEKANLVKTGAPMDFNGNDPVGLFKNGVLIDIIGFPGGEDFARDINLRRNKETTSPKTTFILTEWKVFEMDKTEDLGTY